MYDYYYQWIFVLATEQPIKFPTYQLRRSGMDRSFIPAITPRLSLPCKRSPDNAYTDWGGGYLVAVYYSFFYPERMKS